MKKEQLANIGLTEDQISQVFALYGASVQKFKDDVASKESELESVRGQLTQRDKDLNDLKKKGADVEDIQQKLEDLQAKYKQDTEALETKLADENKSRLIDADLTKAGVRDAEIFEKILNKDEISVKDGKLIGLTEQSKLSVLRVHIYLTGRNKPNIRQIKAMGKVLIQGIGKLL